LQGTQSQHTKTNLAKKPALCQSLSFAFMISFLVFLFCLQQNPAPAQTLTGRAVKIVDGDTFDLLAEGKTYRIRLYGIDCPERNQPYYRQAKLTLGKLCSNQTLTVKYSGKDRNGRIIGNIYTSSNNYINLQMIQQGMAWHFKKYSTEKNLADAELKARKEKVGLWKDKQPIAPWEWRKQ
jgi:micrococcal nuclease